MKLLDQRLLVWRDGAVDRVHELDLLEVAPGRVVVNFRYGKRGSALKDGTKTPMPMALEAARGIFEREIRAKLDKGYEEERGASVGGGATPRAGDLPPTPAPAPTSAPEPPPLRAVPPPPFNGSARAQAVIERIRQGDHPILPATPFRNLMGSLGILQRRRQRQPRPLHRVILRAGDLGMSQAEELLLGLLRGADARRTRSIAAALGRVGGQRSLEALVGLRTHAEEAVRRQALESLRRLSGEEGRRGLAEERTRRLPAELSNAVISGRPDRVQSALERHLSQPNNDNAALLYELYLIDSPAVRPALKAALASLPFTPPWFRAIRQIYQASEYRRDPEIWGTLVRRFETTRAAFRVLRGRSVAGRGRVDQRTGNRLRSVGASATVRISVEGQRQNLDRSSLSRPDATLAWSDRTRRYFRLRSWRVLRRLGQDQSPDFVPMAVGALLPWTDADQAADETLTPRARGRAERQRRRSPSRPRRIAPFGRSGVVHQLLFRTSPRFERPTRRSRLWVYREAWDRHRAAPREREEAFPALWDARPQGLLHLLAESGAALVHEMAVRAALTQPAFVDALDSSVAILLLGRPYAVTADLGLRVARRWWRPDSPDAALVVAAAHSVSAVARAEAGPWMRSAPQVFLRESAPMAALLTGPHSEGRALGRSLLVAYHLEQTYARALTARLIAALQGAEGELAVDIASALEAGLRSALEELGLAVLRDLLRHKSEAVQALAARLLLSRGDEESLGTLLQSDFPAIRALALQCLTRYSGTEWSARPGLLVSLLCSADPAVRQSGRQLLSSLLPAWPSLGSAVAERATAALMEELPPGAPSLLVEVLGEELRDALPSLAEERIWALLRSRRPTAQEAGGLGLGARATLSRIEPELLVALSRHEVLRVRQGLFELLDRLGPALHPHLPTLVDLVDSRWPDARERAFRLLQGAFPAEVWTVELLVGLADSVRPDVQSFAIQLLYRSSSPEMGPELMRRLGEHPSSRVHAVAIGYLEAHGRGDLAALRALRPFLEGVLGRLYQGRVSRQRLHAWLLEEGLRTPEAAALVAELLFRRAGSISVEERARSIQTLVALKRRWPELPSPLKAVEPPLRGVSR